MKRFSVWAFDRDKKQRKPYGMYPSRLHDERSGSNKFCMEGRRSGRTCQS